MSDHNCGVRPHCFHSKAHVPRGAVCQAHEQNIAGLQLVSLIAEPRPDCLQILQLGVNCEALLLKAAPARVSINSLQADSRQSLGSN